MPGWLTCYLVVLGVLAVSAAAVALAVPEDQPDRRKTAFGILKLVITAAGATTVATTLVRLHEAGLF